MPYIDELTDLCVKLSCKIIPNCNLKEYTTFKFGGDCKALISINSLGTIKTLINYLTENKINYTILGRGSNVIVSDNGYDGVILWFGTDFAKIEVKDTKISCQSGALLSAASVSAQQNSLTGMENLFGIPGTVGGAVYMNAGAYGSEISDVIESAEYIDKDGEIHTVKKDEMELSYRKSMFTNSSNIITEVTLKLSSGNSAEIKQRMTECMEKRSSKQPLNYPSAGSTFKRPEGSYASLLIDECGLKGLTVGGAMVSEKHSGFVINKGFATCSDVLELCQKIQTIIKDKTGYNLELEPVLLGNFK